MCVTVWVLRYKNKKNGDRGTIVFTATLILSDRVKDVLGVSISIIRFEKVLYSEYVKARNFSLHKKMQTSYIKRTASQQRSIRHSAAVFS